MYRHGIYVSEQETSMIAPLNGTAGLQVVIRTAPVHLLADPAAAINKPLLVYSKAEAIAAVGYSDDFASFTLCEAISASFAVVNVAPLVLINVLDPDVIVLGGGLSNIASLYRDLPAAVIPYLFSEQCLTPIVPARYGDSSGVRGAAWLPSCVEGATTWAI